MIVGIAGYKNSGKDTVASMINYIVKVGCARATFANWIISRVSYDETNKHRIIHFADNLKKCLSIIYGIPLEYFYDREFKDDKYYCLNRGYFVRKDEKLPNNNVVLDKLFYPDIKGVISKYLKEADKTYNNFTVTPVYISLRRLMQYFGTDICRKQLGDNIWIHSTIREAAHIADVYQVCIIPDVRFSNEAKALRCHSLYGGVIKVNRSCCESDGHESEVIDFDCDYEINNDGSLAELFFKVLDIIQNINIKLNR